MDEPRDDSDRPNGCVGLFFVAPFLLVVVAAVCAPTAIRSRRYHNEASAIGSLKTIITSESIFREKDAEHDGDLDYGMLSELADAMLLDEALSTGRKQGYVFEASYSFLTSEFLWFAVANPRAPGLTGERSFNASQCGMIFYKTDAALALDTNSCSLPNHGVIPACGK
jgi:hypothetical protein